MLPLRRALLAGLLAAPLLGCGEERPVRPPAYVRPPGDPEIDLAERLGLPDGGALEPGARLRCEVGLPPEATLLLAGAGAVEVTVDHAGERATHAVALAEAPPAEVALGSGARRRIELGLAVPADGAAARVDRVAVRVPNRPPDIVVIVVDTLRADVFIDKRQLVTTPRINELARESVPFVEAHAHAPMTLPSHTALFASRPPFETGVLNNGQPVPGDLPLLAEHLRDLGYQTHAVVSLGTLWPREDADETLDRGFDTYVHTPGHVTRAPVVNETLREVLDDVDPVQPLFLFAHFCDPHEPYNVHGKRRDGLAPFTAELHLDGESLGTVGTSDMTYWVRTVELAPGEHRFEVTSDRNLNVRIFKARVDGEGVDVRFTNGVTGEELERFRGKALRHAVAEFENDDDEVRTFELEAWITDHPLGKAVPYRYMREVDYVDRHVGELVDDLKRRGLYDQSVVVFTSDHGEALREHDFTGHVQNLYDEMTHVPLLVKPPLWFDARDRLAARSRDVVRLMDVVPTLLEIGGLPPLPGQRGMSLLDDGSRGPLLSQTHAPEAEEDQVALRDERWKLIYYVDRDEFELFDLTEDPYEQRDVFAEHGDEVRLWQENLKLTARLAERSGLDLDSLTDEQREGLAAIGYGGGEEDEADAPAPDEAPEEGAPEDAAPGDDASAAAGREASPAPPNGR